MIAARIYGFTHGYGSYAQVTRGFVEALDALSERFESDLVSLEEEPSFDEEPTGFPMAEIAILTGPPVAARVLMDRGQHRFRAIMVAPNSDRIPEKIMSAVNEVATHVLVPSRWAARVLEKFTKWPIVVVPHGVAPGFRPAPPTGGLEESYEQGGFRVLHLSSSDKQRKGTLELVQAFGRAMERGLLPKGATLQLVLTPAGRAALLDWMMDRGPMPFLRHSDRLYGDGADPVQLSQIYSAMHLVCQPSRGEGFGMVPLEALACGTPIAATNETGHSEWFRKDLPGATVVKTRGMGPIDDAALATGPIVDVEDIATALGEAYSSWHEKKAEAVGYAGALHAMWSWPNQLRSFFNWAEGEACP